MKGAILKAQKFYFEQFLPAVVPHIIMPSSVVSSSSISTTKESTRVQPKNMQQLIKASAIDNATAVKPVTITLPVRHCLILTQN